MLGRSIVSIGAVVGAVLTMAADCGGTSGGSTTMPSTYDQMYQLTAGVWHETYDCPPGQLVFSQSFSDERYVTDAHVVSTANGHVDVQITAVPPSNTVDAEITLHVTCSPTH